MIPRPRSRLVLVAAPVGGLLLTCVAVAAKPRPDTKPPSTPTGLAVTRTTQTGMALTWNRSHDDVGVTAYNIYVDGKLVGTAPGP